MLHGNLAEFSLADIFQLLALTKKSGELRVRSGAAEGNAVFRDGEIVYAASDARRLPLGARLVGAGLITDEQLRAALDAPPGAATASLDQRLLDSGAVDGATLATVAREQIQDAVFDLVRADEGTFSFEPGQQGGPTLGPVLATEQLVTEASRRLGEWASIRERIPSADAVLAMVPAPPDGAEHVTLTREQWRLLTLVDGVRNVRDLVEFTGQGEFATCRVLGSLVDAGLIEANDPSSGQPTALAGLVARRGMLRRLEQIQEPAAAPDRVEAPPARPPRAARQLEESPRVETPAPQASEDRGPEPTTAAPGVVPPQPTSTPRHGSASPATQPDSSPPDVGEGLVDEQLPVSAPDEERERPGIDGVQVAREPASLDHDEDAAPASPTAAARPDAPSPEEGQPPGRPLARDEDINRGLLLRLIDGVKGA
ncbi:MAG: DUF4388 domain-containing protein [Actinomycetota bacterium]|nr:DUF4388 domain-containing protein [Actinomycetota bacterium]